MTTVIRAAVPADASPILKIYAPYIESTAITFEYDVPSLGEFERRIAAVTRQFPWLLAERGGEAAGYAYAAAFKSRAAYQWDAELSVYIKPKFQRAKIAAALYSCLFELLALQGYRNLYACITLPNEKSVPFHASLGFTPVGVYHRSGYKLGRWHDILYMEKMLDGAAAEPPPLIAFPALGRETVDAVLRRGGVTCRPDPDAAAPSVSS